MRPGSARGFTYVWMLALLALAGVALSVVGPRWADAARREREQDLLHVGLLYAQALCMYHATSPGSEPGYPPTLEAVLEDTRHVGTYRYLRKLWRDPIDPTTPWGLVRDGRGAVRGVYSTSEQAPLRTEPLELGRGLVQLPAATSYRQWLFAPRTPPAGLDRPALAAYCAHPSAIAAPAAASSSR
jgi:type II secretory pathway pseudopilin PulG